MIITFPEAVDRCNRNCIDQPLREILYSFNLMCWRQICSLFCPRAKYLCVRKMKWNLLDPFLESLQKMHVKNVLVSMWRGQYSISKSFPFFILITILIQETGNTSRPVNLDVVHWLVSYGDENDYGNDNGNEIEDWPIKSLRESSYFQHQQMEI